MKQEPVCRRTVTVNLPEGLHLRPISQIAQLAGRFDCDVSLRNGDARVNAKSQLELMTLRADQGDTLVVEATGESAAEAVESLARLFDSDFEDENLSAP